MALYSNNGIELRRPASPLANGALEIQVSQTGQEERIYQLLQKLSLYWRAPTPAPLASAFFCLERRDSARSMTMRQVIPYPHGGLWGYLRQVQVVWNANVPRFMSLASSRLLGEQNALQASLQKDLPQNVETLPRGSDPFCHDGQLAKQQVFEGRHVRVLFNFKPLSPLDFLIVSKEHCETFDKVKQETFVEAMRIGNALTEHYRARYPIAYMNHANGRAAGQTVFHWHLHVTMAAGKIDELMGSLKVIGKMLGLVRPLSDHDLAKRIDGLRTELAGVIQAHSQPPTLVAGGAKKDK